MSITDGQAKQRRSTSWTGVFLGHHRRICNWYSATAPSEPAMIEMGHSTSHCAEALSVVMKHTIAI